MDSIKKYNTRQHRLVNIRDQKC